MNGTEKQIKWAENIISEITDVVNDRMNTLSESIEKREAKLAQRIADGKSVGRRAESIANDKNELSLWETALRHLSKQDASAIIDMRDNLKNIFVGYNPAVLETNTKRRGASWARLANGMDLWSANR